VTTPPASPESPSSPILPPEPRHRSRARKIVKWTALSLVAILVLAAGGLVADYYYINGKLTKVGTYIPSNERPTKLVTKAENFVLIGSDTRAGKSGKGTGGGDITGARSDTTIILHISANGSGATLISIPRDSYVQIPACEIGPNGQTSTPTMGKFNEAYSIGADAANKYAPSCTVHTIETLTGIKIDHFAVVDFAGFERMVSALGGVRMCVAHRLYDPIVGNHTVGFHGSGLDLQAGPSVEIDGTQALALMRARYALDGGGDLPRIKRQQQFIGAMIRKATSTGLLIHPLELQRFLVAAASSVTTDGFGLGTMRKLAGALHNAGAGGVRILTVPNLTSYPGMPYGDVMWDPSKAPELWNAIRNDQPIPGTKPTASPSPTPSGPRLSVAPSSITVNVLNGTGRNQLAHKVATALQAQGFQIGTVGDAPKSTTYPSTVVKYGSNKVQSSQTVAASIPGSIRQADPTSTDTITVIVGANYTKVVPVKITGATPSSTPSPKISSFSAAKNSCLR
jgi:LCP family protein required for cell wall assembly